MRIHHPPGRAGRPWLSHRLGVARRAAEVLDEKRRALLRERARLRPIAREAEREWVELAGQAERWLERTAILAGEHRLLAAAPVGAARARVDVAWRSVLGAICPAEPRVAAAPGTSALEVGGSAALPFAAESHSRALDAAARWAAARLALERIEDELERTALRGNAVERRWIPAHEDALIALDFALEELEREDAARVRWLGRGRAEASSGGTSVSGWARPRD